jgi:large repetitive protein
MRLPGTTAAGSVIVNEGSDNAAYSGGAGLNKDPGPLGGTAMAARFDGVFAHVNLPTNLVSGATYQSVSMWFKEPTTASDGVLFSYQLDPISNTTTSAQYTPSLYVGSDGKLYGEFWTGRAQPIATDVAVNDGNWHMVSLAAAGNTQTLYLDGTAVGSLSNPIVTNSQLNDYVGTEFLGGDWPDETHHGQNGTMGYRTYFTGDISDVGFWDRHLTATEIAAMYAAGNNRASLLTAVTRPSGTTYQSVTYNTVEQRRLLDDR